MHRALNYLFQIQYGLYRKLTPMEKHTEVGMIICLGLVAESGLIKYTGGGGDNNAQQMCCQTFLCLLNKWQNNVYLIWREGPQPFWGIDL